MPASSSIGPDRKIDAAADDDERFTDRQGAQNRKIAQDIAKVVDGGEARRSQRQDNGEHDKRKAKTLRSRACDSEFQATGKRQPAGQFPRPGRCGRLAVGHGVQPVSIAYAAGHGTLSIFSLVTI